MKNYVYVIIYEKDNHVLGVCENMDAITRHLEFLEEKKIILTQDDIRINIFRVTKD